MLREFSIRLGQAALVAALSWLALFVLGHVVLFLIGDFK